MTNGEGEITAQAGRSPLGRTTIEVVYPSMEDRDLEVDHASMVGDISADGAIIHNRYDGTEIQVAARAQDTIQAIGQQGDNVTITIGDIRDPNLAPIAAYYMNDVHEDVVQDDTGRYHLQATGVTRAIGTAMGAGHSLSFQTDNDPSTDGNQGSKLFTDNLTLLQQTQNIGFSIEVRPLGGSTGTLVNLGQGAQTLAFNQYGQLEYRIQTDTGTYSVSTSNAVLPGTWHKIAARYYNGQIELWVNGTSYTDTASGNLSHTLTGYTQLEDIANPANNHDLVIGDGFGGQINSLKWYNWNGQPVMTFADGTTQTTVTLPAPTDGTTLARQELVVRSTGRLQENGSQLGLLRVAIHTNKVRQYASLLSTDIFSALAGQYVNTLATDAPPINLSGLTPQQNLLGNPVWPQTASRSFLISNAYAAEESSLAWDVFNFFIPVESIGVLVEQLQYLVSDPDKFDAAEFIIALVDTITILPPAKPLKAFTRPLQAMTKVLRPLNPKFTKHFAGAFGKMWSKIKKGDTDTLLNLLPFLVIAAEMYSDEEARKGLEFLVKTVASPDDIIAWIDYLALPADGWEGEGNPPEVESFPDDQQTGGNWSRWMGIESAYAAARVKRIAGTVFGRAFGKVAQKIDPEAVTSLAPSLKIIKDNLKVTDFKELRKHVFKSDMLTSAAWLATKGGARSLRNFMVGKSNARYSPIIIASTMGYLGWESACGIAIDKQANGTFDPQTDLTPEDLGCEGKGFNAQVRDQVARKIGIVFADSITAKLIEERVSDEQLTLVGASGHGALFHLVQIAQYQLQHRYAGGDPIKGVELSRWVALFLDRTKVPNTTEELVCGKSQDGCYLKRLRYVDIVLNTDEGEHWVELKSWSAQGETVPARNKLVAEKIAGKFVRWDITKSDVRGKSTTLHRQFSLDRAASVIQAAWLTKRETQKKILIDQVPVVDFEWRFQAFKVTDRKSKERELSPLLGKANERGTLRYLVTARPEAKGLGNEKAKQLQQDSFGTDTGISSHMKLATTGTLMKDLARGGFDMAIDVVEDTIDSD